MPLNGFQSTGAGLVVVALVIVIFALIVGYLLVGMVSRSVGDDNWK